MASFDRKFEKLTKLLKRISVKAAGGIPIIVEGKKDEVALRTLGIEGYVICLKNSKQAMVDLLDNIQSEEIILFVDFDKVGVELMKEITQYLEGKSVNVDFVLWMSIRSLVRRDVKDVEGLPSYLEKLKKRVV